MDGATDVTERKEYFETNVETDPKALKRCEEWKQFALKSVPAVRYMMKHLNRAGCPMPYRNFQCENCGPELSGGYRPDGTITICSNNVVSQTHTNETIVHELVHAFDDCRAEVEWTNCEHLACSEIRAATLSGDCRWWNEMMRGNRGFAGQFKACVRRRAELSVKMSPNCTESQALLAVNKVFNDCYADTEPFYRIP